MKRAIRPLVAGALFLICLSLFGGLALAETDQETRIWESRSQLELGRMYEQAGDLHRAEDHYRRAIESWAENMEAREGLQRVLQERAPKPDGGVGGSFWAKLFSWVPGLGTGGTPGGLEIVGGLVLLLLVVAVLLKVGIETVRLAYRRARGIPLLALGEFHDPGGRLPGLQHQVASYMNDSGLTIYDEKGAVMPDFNLIGDAAPFPQARFLVRLLDVILTRQVKKIGVSVSVSDGLIHCSIALTDSGTGYVQYLPVVSMPPNAASASADLTRLLARGIADTMLISLARDENTKGLLFQRMGDYQSALSHFRQAVAVGQKRGDCDEYYQACLNLGNLYSFLGLQERSVEAYNTVLERTNHPVTQALLNAAIACSYRWWALTSSEEQRPSFDWLGRQSIERAVGSTHKSALVHYTIGCYYSLVGEFEESLRWLREAVAGDLGFLEYAETDPDLEHLREWLRDKSIGEALGLRIG